MTLTLEQLREKHVPGECIICHVFLDRSGKRGRSLSCLNCREEFHKAHQREVIKRRDEKRRAEVLIFGSRTRDLADIEEDRTPPKPGLPCNIGPNPMDPIREAQANAELRAWNTRRAVAA